MWNSLALLGACYSALIAAQEPAKANTIGSCEDLTCALPDGPGFTDFQVAALEERHGD